ncbi:MAG TPA: HAD family hydrolase [bacterium]|nr:HAD family hydrolase [bacterium]
MTDIKWIILDIDGVIVGDKIGFNSPDPHPIIIERLRKLHKSGVGISLCTAKPHFAIRKIINDANLNNIHITDGGGVIVDPIDKIVAKKRIIDTHLAQDVLQMCLDNNVYVEFYTVDDYFIQDGKESSITKDHRHILQQEPRLLKSLSVDSVNFEITKIIPIAVDEQDKKRVTDLFQTFAKDLEFSWSIHPAVLPLQFGIVTASGVSKRQGSIDISENSAVAFENMLAVGDGTNDWQFIELCKYGAAMGNGSYELKKLVLAKGKECGFVGGSVNEHGLIDIFDHFELG